MDANFDADLEQLERWTCTAQPRDQFEVLHLLCEEEEEGGILGSLHE